MALTSLERIRRAVRHEESDVIPVAPYIGNHGCRIGGAKLGEYCRSGKIMAAAQIRAWEVYGQDVVVAQSDGFYLAEAFGVEVDFHEDSPPTHRCASIMDLKRELPKLHVPDPWQEGRMYVYLEALGLLAEHFKGEVCVRGTGTGPFSLASHLMGLERFLEELGQAEADQDEEMLELLRQLMELTSDALIAFCKAQFEAGAHLVEVGDSLASNSVISPAMYRKWAFPYECKVFGALREIAEREQRYAILHICGDMTRALELMADTGAPIIEIDSHVNLADAKARVGQRTCLLGNLNPTTVLTHGTPELVTRESEAAIRAAGAGGGFILGSGCEIPLTAPPANIEAMVRTARKATRVQ